jgi:UDP-2,4-diacetamido-2,4,6-trideoxy-beta-L-altropyranose hydrolase
MRVVFRVDASLNLGSGHLMRCLTLAETLREQGVKTGFFCRELAGNLIALLKQKGMPVIVLPAVKNSGDTAMDAEQSIVALGGDKPDWLVVDHYELDMTWQTRLRPHVGKLMVIDDLACRHHDCDLLLDQNYSVVGDQRYNGLVPSGCHMLLGPEYALLRKEFKQIRAHLVPRLYQLKKILVFFTSGDDQGETLKAMQGIAAFGRAVFVDVVTGSGNPDNALIRKKCAELDWGYHCQIDYMPRLIAQADLVIGAGGSSNWERCGLGVPALVTILADNQAEIAPALDSAGVIRNLGWNGELQAADYTAALRALSDQSLARMSEKALALVDAQGAERVAKVLLAA